MHTHTHVYYININISRLVLLAASTTHFNYSSCCVLFVECWLQSLTVY